MESEDIDVAALVTAYKALQVEYVRVSELLKNQNVQIQRLEATIRRLDNEMVANDEKMDAREVSSTVVPYGWSPAMVFCYPTIGPSQFVSPVFDPRQFNYNPLAFSSANPIRSAFEPPRYGLLDREELNTVLPNPTYPNGVGVNHPILQLTKQDQLRSFLEKHKVRSIEEFFEKQESNFGLEKLATSTLDSENFENDNDVETSDCIDFHRPLVHPLLQETILGQLKSYLDNNSLAASRSVCAFWNKVLTPVYMKHSTLMLDFSSHKTEYMETFSRKLLSAYPISEFDVQKNLAVGVPSTWSVTIIPQILHRGTQLLLKWLPTFRKKIRTLKLDFSRWIPIPSRLFCDLVASCENLGTLSIPYLRIDGSLNENKDFQLPNLKSLEIGSKKYHVYGHMDSDVQSMKDLFLYTPNLTTLRLNIFNNRRNEDISDLFAVCRNAGYFENLLELELRNGFVTRETLQTLSSIKFKFLQKLFLGSYRVIQSDAAGTAFATLLSNVGSSLQELKLDVTIAEDANESDEEDDDEDPPEGLGLTITSLPEMTSLKRFVCHCDLTQEQGSIDFVLKFPNLEALILTHKCDKNIIFRLFPEVLEFRHDKLRILELPNITLFDKPESEHLEDPESTLNLITACFPKLEVLNIRLPSYKGFESEYIREFEIDFASISRLSQLIDLTICCEGIDDFDFNSIMSLMFIPDGFPFSGLKKFTFNSKYERITLDARTVRKSFKNAPFLQFLELQNFLIKSSEKEEILESVKRINTVRFLDCMIVNDFGKKIKVSKVPDIENVGYRDREQYSRQKAEVWEFKVHSFSDTILKD